MPWNYISCSRLGRCLVLLERLRDESILEADSSSEARYYSITVSHPESDFHDHLGYTHTHTFSLSTGGDSSWSEECQNPAQPDIRL